MARIAGIKPRRGTTAEWAAANAASPSRKLDSGELGYDSTTKDLVVGDGTTAFASLPRVGSGTYGPLNPYPSPGERTPKPASTTQVALSLPDVAIGPNVLVPPASLYAASGASVWYAANAATLMRFQVTRKRTYRYVNLSVGVQSGNIQVAIARVNPTTGSSVNVTRVATSGVIACPAAGAQQIDLGFVTLEPGDYVVSLWCDNTTAQFMHGLVAGITASRLTFSATGLATGLGSVTTTVGTTTRWVSGVSIEAGKLPLTAIGDSITASPDWFTAVNLGTQRFALTNKGTGGNITADMVARFTADYVTPAPRYGSIFGGANDVGGGIEAAAIIANLTTMWAASQAASIPFVACTVLPRWNTSQSDPMTTAQATVLRTVNAWIRANIGSYSLGVLCDWSYALSNDGTDEAAPKAAYFSDQVHPNATGQAVMAEVFRRVVAAWV